MIRYTAVAGTNGARHVDDWHNPKSPFAGYLRTQGFVPLVEDPLEMFGWDGLVDGIDPYDLVWDAMGRALAHHFRGEYKLPQSETFVLGHSHAWQGIAIACARYGLKINGLVTVGSPIRKNLYQTYDDAHKNITRHLHLSAKGDLWQFLGSWLDGGLRLQRECPGAINRRMPGDHDDVLQRPELFPLWNSEGWLDIWRGAQR